MAQETTTASPIYWVIWMPTTIHTSIENNPKQSFVSDNVSDNKSYTQKISAKLTDKDIVLSFSASTITDGESKIKLTEEACVIKLKYIDSSSNGLFLYECECVTNDNATNALAMKPRYAIVHLLKSLYHNHIFHLSSKDTNKDFYFDIYIPPIGSPQPDIKTVNSNAIKHYLQKIEEKFGWAVELFETNLAKISTSKTDKQQIYKEYNYYLGETFFTNTLCHSKYLETQGDENYEVRKWLLNIENLKDYLSFIRDYHRLNLDEQWTNKSIFWTIIAMIIGLVGGFVTSYYTPKLFKDGAQPDSIYELQNHIDSLFQTQKNTMPFYDSHSSK